MAGVRTLVGTLAERRWLSWRVLGVGAAVGSVLGLAVLAWWLHAGLEVGRRALGQGQWATARAALSRYLWLHPRNPAALLLLADAYIRDESIPQHDAAHRAIGYLQRIADSSTYGADARTKEGWVRLFMLQTPGHAEAVLKKACELDRHAVEPRYWLWKLYDLTGRSHFAEPFVWQVLELTPEPDRAMRLREWYMSQFFPLTGCASLDYILGILREGEIPTVDVERRRFQLFRDAEPDQAIGHSALARWLVREGMPQVALEVLQLGEKQMAEEQKRSPFFLATMVEVLIDLGNFTQAQEYFNRWPPEDRGFEYWRWRGVLAEEVSSDYQAAVQAYDQALAIWPGPADWRMRVRKANCLARLGRADEAERVRQEAQQIEAKMENPIHERLRRALANLNDFGSLLAVAEFYRDLGRPREAASWLQLAMQLRSAPADSAPPSSQTPVDVRSPNGAARAGQQTGQVDESPQISKPRP